MFWGPNRWGENTLDFIFVSLIHKHMERITFLKEKARNRTGLFF